MGQHPVQRHGPGVGVAEEAVPVGEGVPGRVYEQVQVLGRVVGHGTQLETLQDVQRLQLGDGAGGHGRAEQLVTPVAGPDRLQDLGLVFGKVLGRQDTTVSLHLLFDSVGDLALVQSIAALPSNALQGLRQVSLDQSLARAGRVAAGEEHPAGLARFDQVGHGPCDHEAGRPIGLEPIPGVVGRGLQELFQGQGAEQFVGSAHPRSHPRHPNRQVADAVGPALDLVYAVPYFHLADHREHVGGGRPGSSVAVVQRDGLAAARHVDDHLAVAGDARVPGLDDVEAEARGNSGVDGRCRPAGGPRRPPVPRWGARWLPPRGRRRPRPCQAARCCGLSSGLTSLDVGRVPHPGWFPPSPPRTACGQR